MSKSQLMSAIKVATEEFARVLFNVFTNASVSDIGKTSSSGALKRSGKTSAKKTAKKLAKKATKRAAAAPVKRKARKPRFRTDMSVAELCEKVLAQVAAHEGGISIGEISQVIEVDTVDLVKPIRVLVAAGKIQRRGERRGAKYFPKG